jgi:hypothetical protein
MPGKPSDRNATASRPARAVTGAAEPAWRCAGGTHVHSHSFACPHSSRQRDGAFTAPKRRSSGCTLGVHITGIVTSFPAPSGRSGLTDDVLERLEGLVEPLLAATVLLVVGLRSNVAKQLFEIVLASGQHGAVIVTGEACSKYEPLASGVDET